MPCMETHLSKTVIISIRNQTKNPRDNPHNHYRITQNTKTQGKIETGNNPKYEKHIFKLPLQA